MESRRLRHSCRRPDSSRAKRTIFPAHTFITVFITGPNCVSIGTFPLGGGGLGEHQHFDGLVEQEVLRQGGRHRPVIRGELPVALDLEAEGEDDPQQPEVADERDSVRRVRPARRELVRDEVAPPRLVRPD
eukprot:gene2846-biopygen2283